MFAMARAATTTDAFNAVAEPRRRQILDVLAGGERPVSELVEALGLAQPQVSKHLGVLRKVGLVDVVQRGKRRMYSLNGENHINYEARMEDPKTFSRPWTIRLPLYRRLEPNVQLLEFKCVEFSEELLYGDLKKK